MLEEEKTKKHEKKVSAITGVFFSEMFRTILIVVLLVVVTRFFIIQPFIVKGSSMEPNFQDNEYIFVEEVSSKVAGFSRGNVVIFKHPENQCTQFINESFIKSIFLQGPCTNFIKRVIGLPGETMVIKDGTIKIKNKEHPDGFILDESYIPKDDTYKLKGDMTRTIKEDEYFVLGDNRQPNASLDSREWGVLPKNHITGKAWLVVLPFDKFGLVSHPKY